MENVDTLFFNNAILKEDGNLVSTNTIIESIDAYARINCQSALIVDFDEHTLLYKSKHMLFIDEATDMDYKRSCANPYWSLVSEDILEKLLLIRKHYPLLGKSISEEEYCKHTCVIDYPIQLKKHDMFITQVFTPLQMRSDGITKIGLFVFHPSSKNRMESMVCTPYGRLFSFDFVAGKFREDKRRADLSSTEIAVLNRIRMGMTSEEIAASLYISVNTVKTHRAKIFKKLNVTTINEAITVVDNYQLLQLSDMRDIE